MVVYFDCNADCGFVADRVQATEQDNTTDNRQVRRSSGIRASEERRGRSRRGEEEERNPKQEANKGSRMPNDECRMTITIPITDYRLWMTDDQIMIPDTNNQ